eukprot:7187399-Pyramimonas_sp.AAC.1
MGETSDHHEGHQSASSMAPPTTYREYQHALPNVHFEGGTVGDFNRVSQYRYDNAWDNDRPVRCGRELSRARVERIG